MGSTCHVCGQGQPPPGHPGRLGPREVQASPGSVVAPPRPHHTLDASGVTQRLCSSGEAAFGNVTLPPGLSLTEPPRPAWSAVSTC